MKRKTRSVTILITVISGLLTAASGIFGNIASSQVQGLQFAWLVFCLLTIGGIGFTLWQSLRLEKEKPLSVKQERNSRQRLLAKVRSFWIEGVLDHSLYGAVLIALGLHEHLDAVTDPWKLMFQQSDHKSHPLPDGTHITQVYDDAGGELLILGEPGSGKTTLLLELARDLLDRARLDIKHPMPVVFNLSSWAVKRQSISRWLVEELNIKYPVFLLKNGWPKIGYFSSLMD